MPSLYVTALADALLAEPLAGVVGVYLHGSAVLGGYRPGGSDVDVLVRWGREHGHLSYAVLNACRALRLAADGVPVIVGRKMSVGFSRMDVCSRSGCPLRS